jgi:hypothetical protein
LFQDFSVSKRLDYRAMRKDSSDLCQQMVKTYAVSDTKQQLLLGVSCSVTRTQPREFFCRTLRGRVRPPDRRSDCVRR